MGTGRYEHPTSGMQGATLMPGHANRHPTHNDIKPGVEANHLPCKRDKAWGWEGALRTTRCARPALQGAAKGAGWGIWMGMRPQLLAEGDGEIARSLLRYQHH